MPRRELRSEPPDADEYIAIAETFGYDADTMQTFVLNALHASFLPENRKKQLQKQLLTELSRLQDE